MTNQTHRRALLATAKVACAVSLFTGCQGGTIQVDPETGDSTRLVRGETVDTAFVAEEVIEEVTEEEQCLDELTNTEWADVQDWDRIYECCDLLGNPWEIGFCSPWGPPTPCSMPTRLAEVA